jgi:RNA polymerase sigma-70 factor (ECF subfamily)
LRDANDTADLVQVALMRVLAHLDRFESGHAGAFYAYLRQTLLNALRDALRERRLQPAREDEAVLVDLPAASGSALESALGREGAIAYEQALQRLPPHHQALVVMRFEFGMSFPEIAAELDESADGVRIKLQRVLKKMAETLHDPDAD